MNIFYSPVSNGGYRLMLYSKATVTKRTEELGFSFNFNIVSSSKEEPYFLTYLISLKCFSIM